MSLSLKNVVWFDEVDKDDISLVGGKGANLGEMTKAGFAVPNGFIVTATAYYRFIKENNLAIKIKNILKTINYQNSHSLSQVSSHIKRYITEAGVPNELTQDIFKSYRRLGGPLKDARVAVRSSATAEDLPGASFAGQQETFLNVTGEANLLIAIKAAWASLFNSRAIFYRHEKHFDHFKVGIAIPVQKMVESEKSGIMFTIDPVTNSKAKIVIEAILGLGELIVQGEVTPDHYEISKNDFTILIKDIQTQVKELKRAHFENKIVKISKLQGSRQKLTDKEIVKLAKLGQKLEEHYYFPQDIEWAIEKDKIYIVQTRPVTTIQKKKELNHDNYTLDVKRYTLLLRGAPASPGIASGPTTVVKDPKEIDLVEKGDVLVTSQTSPDYVPAMKRAVAIVTEHGGRTSHAAIVSRELGIPAVVGAEKAVAILKKKMIVTVNGSTGEVFKGGHITVKSSSTIVPSALEHIRTHTKVYVNLAEPERAKEISALPVDGIGLLRAEFMMAQIGTHPKKMIKMGKDKDFVQQLADGLEQFCSSFYPRPVVYRTSDFKTNEYRNLVGGDQFEPIEPNPMLGFRGAFRYIADPQVFELELKAIRYVREKKKLMNLWLMLPYVRTVKELVAVKKLVSSAGLYRSNNFKLWMMVEIPSNVILLDKFIYSGIDGVSIGSNDLTMLLLGTDRDNNEVAPAFDEQNEAVLWALEKVIKTCHRYKITSSICGQAPSLYPALVEKLVGWGVTSVSVAPDAVLNVKKTIQQCEQKLLHQQKSY